jgi:hypothetical protein
MCVTQLNYATHVFRKKPGVNVATLGTVTLAPADEGLNLDKVNTFRNLVWCRV